MSYEWTTPDGRSCSAYKGRYWAYSEREDGRAMDGMVSFITESTGDAVQLEALHGRDARECRYRRSGMTFSRLSRGSDERLGYPTQKPLALTGTHH